MADKTTEKIRSQPVAPVLPLPAGLSGRSLAVPDRLVESFRDLILRGEWQPGAPVVETSIARAIGVSQPTVREALKHLEAEGLIVRRQHRSSEVTRLSSQEVDQIFRLRVEWESLAVELAIENRGNWAPSQLTAEVERLRRAAQDHDVEAFYRHDLGFHRALWSCTGNPFLVRALSQITVPLFAFWALPQLREFDVDLLGQADSHERIAVAVISGELRQARKVMREAMKSFWREGVRVAGQA